MNVVPMPEQPRRPVPADHLGVDPEAVWVEALESAGHVSTGPDRAGEYTTTCPAHPDRSPSFRWRRVPSGRILFYCHAGCTYEEILDALSLERWQLDYSKVVYEYTDDEGYPTFRVVRYNGVDGKGFRLEHPDVDTDTGEMRWVRGKGEDYPDVWRADAIRAWAAARPEESVLWLVEGEKDTVSLASVVEPADIVTTVSGGSKQWGDVIARRVADLAGGAPVRVLGDNDQAGVTRVRRAVSDLRRIGVEVSGWLPESEFNDITEVVDEHGEARWRDYITEIEDNPLAEPTSLGLYLDRHPADPDRFVLWSEVKKPGKNDPPAFMRFNAGVAPLGKVTGEEPGWVVEISDPLRTTIAFWPERTLGSRSQYEQHRLDMPPAIGAYATFGTPWEQIRAYLLENTAGLPEVAARERFGWNRPGPDETEWSFVGTDGDPLIGTGRCFRRAPSRYRIGSCSQAAAAATVAKVLNWREPAESAPVLAWVAARALWPAVQSAYPEVSPVLSVTGGSGTGKTAFIKRAMLLTGLRTNGIGDLTVAGLKGEYQVFDTVWIDDANLDGRIGDAVRQIATATDRTRGTADMGLNHTHFDGFLLYSGESTAWATERAHLERTAYVDFVHNAQTRTNPDGTPQWFEMGPWERSPEGQDAAGAIVTGLAQYADVSQAPSGGRRGETPYRALGWTGEVLAQWLDDNGQPEAAAVMREGLTGWVEAGIARASERLASGSGQDLTDLFLPRYLQWCGSDRGGYQDTLGVPLVTGVPRTVDSVRSAIRDVAMRTSAHLPAVIAVGHPDGSWSVAFNQTRLVTWLSDQHGGQRYTDIRNSRAVSASGVRAQAHAVPTVPGWNDKVKVGSTMRSFSLMTGSAAEAIVRAAGLDDRD